MHIYIRAMNGKRSIMQIEKKMKRKHCNKKKQSNNSNNNCKILKWMRKIICSYGWKSTDSISIAGCCLMDAETVWVREYTHRTIKLHANTHVQIFGDNDIQISGIKNSVQCVRACIRTNAAIACMHPNHVGTHLYVLCKPKHNRYPFTASRIIISLKICHQHFAPNVWIWMIPACERDELKWIKKARRIDQTEWIKLRDFIECGINSLLHFWMCVYRFLYSTNCLRLAVVVFSVVVYLPKTVIFAAATTAAASI